MLSLKELCIEKIYNTIELTEEEEEYLTEVCYDNPLILIKNRIIFKNDVIKRINKDIKLDTLIVGEVQSGKTTIILHNMWLNEYIYKRKSIVVLRNSISDVYQFMRRIDKYNEDIVKDKRYYISYGYIKYMNNIEKVNGIVSIMNNFQMDKLIMLIKGMEYITKGHFIKNSIYGVIEEGELLEEGDTIIINRIKYKITYKQGGNICLDNKIRKTGEYKIYKINDNNNIDKKYSLLVDEVDISKKSNYNYFKIDGPLNELRNLSESIYGFTATSFCSIVNGGFKRLIKLEPPKNYRGINDINIELIEDIREEKTENKIIDEFMKKKQGIMLYNVKSYKTEHYTFSSKVFNKYKKLCVIVHNSDGYTLYSRGKGYKGSRKIEDNIYNFKNIQFSKVLQLIKDEKKYKHVIIVGRISCGRGMSYVSSDYKWYITDQIYYIKNNNISKDKILQSMRCFGVNDGKKKVTLWTNENTYNRLRDYYEYHKRCIDKMDKISINGKDIVEELKKIPSDKNISVMYDTFGLKRFLWDKVNEEYYPYIV